MKHLLFLICFFSAGFSADTLNEDADTVIIFGDEDQNEEEDDITEDDDE